MPCTPSNLNVDINCQTNVAVLSWNDTKGAVKYSGLAQSPNGDTFNCDTTNSSCTLKTMQCGNVYNFTVKAWDGICNSSVSSPLQAGAGNYWLKENKVFECCVNFQNNWSNVLSSQLRVLQCYGKSAYRE